MKENETKKALPKWRNKPTPSAAKLPKGKRKIWIKYLVNFGISIIAGIIASIIFSFIRITPLENEIENFETTIKNQNTQINDFKTTIQQQNTQINNFETKFNKIQAYIETNYGPINF